MSVMPVPLKSKYRIIDVQEVLDGLPDIPRDVITHAAFGTLDPRLWEVLVDDLWIETFSDAVKHTLTDLQSQMSERKAAEKDPAISAPHDPDWWRRITKVRSRCEVLNSFLRARLKDYKRRVSFMDVETLLRAISLHKHTVLEEYQPTSADEELWKVLS